MAVLASVLAARGGANRNWLAFLQHYALHRQPQLSHVLGPSFSPWFDFDKGRHRFSWRELAPRRVARRSRARPRIRARQRQGCDHSGVRIDGRVSASVPARADDRGRDRGARGLQPGARQEPRDGERLVRAGDGRHVGNGDRGGLELSARDGSQHREWMVGGDGRYARSLVRRYEVPKHRRCPSGEPCVRVG